MPEQKKDELDKILDNVVIEKINKNWYIENREETKSQINAYIKRVVEECMPKRMNKSQLDSEYTQKYKSGYKDCITDMKLNLSKRTNQ